MLCEFLEVNEELERFIGVDFLIGINNCWYFDKWFKLEGCCSC